MKKLLSLIMVAMLASPCYGADEWLKTQPASTDLAASIGTLVGENNESLDRLLSNYRQNCLITYTSATAISVAAGEVVCSNSGGTVRKFRKNTSATAVTFADIDTGAEAASTTYYVYACADADATTFTVKISASASAPTGITYYKRIGSFYNDGSSNISNDDSLVNDNNYYALRLGDWVSKSSDTAYQATTDGFVVAYATTSGDDAQYGLQILTDASNPPTTVVAQADIGGGPTVNAGSDLCATSPVKKTDYYKVVSINSATVTAYFIPLSREV